MAKLPGGKARNSEIEREIKTRDQQREMGKKRMREKRDGRKKTKKGRQKKKEGPRSLIEDEALRQGLGFSQQPEASLCHTDSQLRCK